MKMMPDGNLDINKRIGSTWVNIKYVFIIIVHLSKITV